MPFAFVFPGQGSQSVGMLKAYEGLPEIGSTFAEASQILGQDLYQLVQEGPAEALAQTVNTQPVMFTAGVALFRAWKALGGAMPKVMAGHSLAEYSALVAAGAMDFAETLPLVHFRAAAMQEAVAEGEGAMAAILGLDEDLVIEACREAAQGQVVEAVNLNSPGQIVIGGHKAAVQRASEIAKAKGAKRAVLLAMSVPSHCVLMKPAAERLREQLGRIAVSSPSIPVVQNADVQAHADPDAIKDALVRQLYSPVRWIETVRSFTRYGVTVAVECGPGKVLGGLTKRIDSNLGSLTFSDAASMQAALSELS